MMSDRCIIVHNLEQAKAALAAAQEYACPVTLRSAPDGAAFLSAAVFREIIEEAANSAPEAKFTVVLDCGNEPGLALNALRQGIKTVRLDVPDDVRQKVSEIAQQLNASVETNNEKSVLDLGFEKDPDTACRHWLNKDRANDT